MKNQYQKFAILLLITFVLGVVTHSVFSSGAGTFYISEGLYSGSPTFTIWKADSTYYFKNAYGRIAYSGTDLEALIESAISGGNKYLYFKEGTFTIDGRIDITTSNIIFEGSGFGTIITSSQELPMGSDIQIFYAHGNSKSDCVSGITIKNMKIDGQADNQNHHPIIFKYIYNSSIQNVWVYGGEEGIHCQYSDKIIIDNNFVEQTYGSGIELNPDCDGNIVSNNILRMNVRNSTTEQGGAIRIWYGISYEYCDDNIITDNVISYSGYDGIKIKGGNRTIISDNTIKFSSNSGIYLYASPYTLVSSNEVLNSVGNGIESSGGGVGLGYRSIINNKIINSSSGILQYYCNYSIVSQNMIDTTTVYGIAFTFIGNGSECIISENLLKNIGDSMAIRLTDLQYSIISFNIARGKDIRTRLDSDYNVIVGNIADTINYTGTNNQVDNNITGA